MLHLKNIYLDDALIQNDVQVHVRRPVEDHGSEGHSSDEIWTVRVKECSLLISHIA